MRKIFVLVAFLSLFSFSAFAQVQPENYAVTNFEMRLSAIEEQMRGLTGKVEQVDYMLRRIDNVLKRMQEDYDIRFSELEKDKRKSASIPLKAQTNQKPIVGTLGNVKINGNKVTGGAISPNAPVLPDKPADYGLTPQEQYDRAFDLLRQADYKSASGAFKKFFDKNKKHKLASNAKYWYGETFYVRGKYGKAAIAFAEAYQHDNKGPKAPDSLLKLSMSLGALNKKADACKALLALKIKFPKANKSIRKRSKREMRRLKCK